MKERSPERKEFLQDILTGAIENYGHGWFYVNEYKWEDLPVGGAFAVIEPQEPDGDEVKDQEYGIDIDVIAKGLGVIRRAVMKVDEQLPDDGEVLHNASTGQRLYMSERQRSNIMLADRTNAEEGDLDVIDYLAIVECGLFGRVVFA